MTVVCLQNIGHGAGDLALEVVHDDQGWHVIFKGFPSTVDIMLSMFLIMVASFDQCFGEWVISHPGGTHSEDGTVLSCLDELWLCW